MNCTTLPVVANAPLPIPKIVAECGKWITLCGRGKHSISYFLGEIQAPVTVWYQRSNPEDELYVMQFGEVILAAPLNDAVGSFTFPYAPYSDEEGMDEIVLVHEGRLNSSRVQIRLDCQIDPCLPETTVTPGQTETTVKCGKSWHQAGYVKKNTILLGDDPGYVTVQWAVDGSGEVIFFQDKTVLATLTSNREGSFTFYYDPEKGDVYARTQGTATVDYIFTCPFVDVPVEVPTYEFVCGDDPYTFSAPLEVEVKLPVVIGTIDITMTVTANTAVEFRQNNVPFYVLQGHTGTVNFSYDYNPDNGKVTVFTTGYGEVTVQVDCPYNAPDPDPAELTGECGTTIATYAGYSNITMDMNNVSGETILDIVIPSTTTLTVMNVGTTTITKSGTYTIQYDKSLPFIIQARGADFQMRASCPVRTPLKANLNCGDISAFLGPSEITMKYGSTPGNTTITTTQDCNVYRDGVLVGFGRSVTFFYPGTGTVLVKCDVIDEYCTFSATCPAIQTMNCGTTLHDFNGGDVIDVSFATPLIRGHVKFGILITGNVSAAFRSGNTTFHTSTQTEDFEQILNTAEGLRIVSTGTGTFKLKVECAAPISIVGVETKTEKVDCPSGQTSNGVPGGATFVTATWTITTYSDNTVVTSTKTYDGVCKVPQEVGIRPARWGVAMFANKNFTGGPIASEITQEEKDYGVTATTSPSGKAYTHWTGIQDFATKVMTNTFTPTSTDTSGVINPTITVDDFVYVMWDARAADTVSIINMSNNFEVTFEGILWRNDLLGNYEGLPGYNPSLPTYLKVTFDDGTGARDWIIIRQETTTLPEYSPRTDKYSVKYVVKT
jgi:hypothetical protein